MFILWIVAGLMINIGLGLMQGGASRSKNTAASLFRSLLHTAVAILAFWVCGQALISGLRSDLFDIRDQGTLVQAMLCAVSANIVGGAILERSRPIVGVSASFIMAGIITPLAWRLSVTDFLFRHGYTDSAGAGFIYIAAGVAAAVVAVLLGPRMGKFNRDGSTNNILGHSIPMSYAGVVIILVGWIMYVSVLGDPNQSATDAVLAACASFCAATIFSQIRYSRTDIRFVFAGLLGGLVSITAAPERMSGPMSVVAGAIAGVIVPYAAVTLELRWKIDDPINGISIFGIGGLWASIAAAVLVVRRFSNV